MLDLPPFWLAFAFVALASLPQAFLALPIAAAPMGALPSVAIVIVVALLNTLGTAGLAEAIVRLPPDDRPRTVEGVARAYLGAGTARVVALSMLTILFVALVAASLSFSFALAGFTGTPRLPWLVLLAVAVLAITSRATIGFSTAIILGACSAALIGAIALAVVPDIRVERLSDIHLPLTAGRDLAPDLWSTILGVVLLTFFGQIFLPPAATFVLPRDPGGRSFIRGSVAGMSFLAVLVVAWLLAVDTAVFPGSLIGLHGTVLVTLGRNTGPLVTALGTLLVPVLPGLTAVRCAGLLANQVRAVQGSPASAIVPRLVLPALPSLLAFTIVGGLIVTGTGDVSSTIALGGVLGASIVVGMAPPVLAYVARRAAPGAIPGALRLAGHPAVITVQVGFVATVVLAYGLVVWQNPVERLAALVVSLGALAWFVRFATRQRT